MATLIDNPKRARQLARAIASDLTLYHEPKIREAFKTYYEGAEIGDERRFSDLRTSLSRITPRALALSLQDLEAAGFVRREVLPTRPPSSLYRPTARGRRVQQALEES